VRRSERTSRLLDQIELQFEELESRSHLPRERVIVPGPTACLCCGGERLRNWA
jgi:transposase